MKRLSNKVAFISGVARGQGRSHAVRLAREGADIVGFDLCSPMKTVAYPMATPDDLAQTVELVEAEGRRMVAEQADVRDFAAVKRTLERGLEEFAHVDIVLANAGIMTLVGEMADHDQAWQDSIDVMLTGAYNTVRAAVPSMIERGEGGAIVLTSSTAGLKGMGSGTAGSLGYTAAKHGVVGLMRAFANHLGPHFIRVNSVHPTGTNTPMVANEAFLEWVSENPQQAEGMQNLIPVPMVDPEDISNAVAWLVSDEAQYVTGITMPVDAGFTVR